MYTLTIREQEVLRALLEGNTPREISFNINIAHNTVLSHEKSIYRKLKVKNIGELFARFKPATDTGTAPNFAENFGFFWFPICDKFSTSTIANTCEEINGETKECITMDGTMSNYNYAYSGIAGNPNVSTMKTLKTMESFSFRAMGDGKSYTVRLKTVATLDGDHWLYIFPTVKDEIITVTVNVPDDFYRIGWNRKNVDFIQKDLLSIHIQTESPGPYHLKFWDITLNQ